MSLLNTSSGVFFAPERFRPSSCRSPSFLPSLLPPSVLGSGIEQRTAASCHGTALSARHGSRHRIATVWRSSLGSFTISPRKQRPPPFPPDPKMVGLLLLMSGSFLLLMNRCFLHSPPLSLHPSSEEPWYVLVRQYRPPVQSYVIEFPAGLLDLVSPSSGDSEDAEGRGAEEFGNCALRELREETGYSGQLEPLPELHRGPGGPGTSPFSPPLLLPFLFRSL